MVEEKLKGHFELAQLWNAVLLLDEADVFLQARDVDGANLHRNSLVSGNLLIPPNVGIPRLTDQHQYFSESSNTMKAFFFSRQIGLVILMKRSSLASM